METKQIIGLSLIILLIVIAVVAYFKAPKIDDEVEYQKEDY